MGDDKFLQIYNGLLTTYSTKMNLGNIQHNLEKKS